MSEFARMQVEDECEPVQLQPFKHQVGGHTSMLQCDNKTLCKLCTPREHSFYSDMPNALKQYAPEFRGTILTHLGQRLKSAIIIVRRPVCVNFVIFVTSLILLYGVLGNFVR